METATEMDYRDLCTVLKEMGYAPVITERETVQLFATYGQVRAMGNPRTMVPLICVAKDLARRFN